MVKFPAIYFFLLLFFLTAARLTGQAFLLEKKQSGISVSLDGYRQSQQYGAGLTITGIPAAFLELGLSLGKFYDDGRDKPSQLIAPQITLYPLRFRYDSPLSFSLTAAYSIMESDSETPRDALLFTEAEKIRRRTLGGSLYYVNNINKNTRFFPHIRLLWNWRRYTFSSVEENKQAEDFSDLFTHNFIEEKDAYGELVLGITISRKIRGKQQLFFQLNGRYQNRSLDKKVRLGIIF